ncbi:MAG TPA: BON domain-containing protein [Pyrinomonadaceae bacterium]|nr:BON domain-containing protein [Pyrinomonadaceae bacterium]
MKRFSALAAGMTLALLTFGCGGGDSTNSNAGANANAVVVNNNASRNTGMTTNTNSTANNNGTFNANISQGDYDKQKDAFGQKAKDLGDKVGTGLSDGWLWVKTRGALMAADGLEETGINVDVNNGAVTLRGTVPSQDQLKKADAAAKGVSGSKSVQNQIKVGAAGGNTNANAAKK